MPKTQPELERRVAIETWPLADLELRSESDGLNFRGYAAVFDAWSEDLGGFRERIRPGAFANSIAAQKGRAIKMFLNHNNDIVLGSTRKGSLRLSEDDKGLVAEATLPDNEWGRPVADAVRRGDIDSMSFGFEVIRDANPSTGERWYRGDRERELIEVRLHEVSPVTGWPAYPTTSVAVRALDGVPDEMIAAIAALTTDGSVLTDEQLSLLNEAINARRAVPLRREKWLAEFASLRQ